MIISLFLPKLDKAKHKKYSKNITSYEKNNARVRNTPRGH